MSAEKKNKKHSEDLVAFLLKEEKTTAIPSATAVVPAAVDDSTHLTEENKQKVEKSIVDHQQVKITAPSIEKTKLTPSKPSYSVPSERVQQATNEVEKLVGNAQAIKVAQARITELEKERDELRDEVEKLLLSSEALKKNNDEQKSVHESLERKFKEKNEANDDEKVVLKARLNAREKEWQEIKKVNSEMEGLFQTELKKIRVREREYENRNQILKAEFAALSRLKDDSILDLKRQIDQLHDSIENFKARASDSDQVLSQVQERQTRAIKALRVALQILESDIQVEDFKKAAGDE